MAADRLRRMRLRCWSISITDGVRSFDDEDDGYRRRIHAEKIPSDAKLDYYRYLWTRGFRFLKWIPGFSEAFIGFMWVAVYGMNSINVATRTDDLEREWFLPKVMFGRHPDLHSRNLLWESFGIVRIRYFIKAEVYNPREVCLSW